jgi:dipeptidyl-peptidase 4
MRICNLGLSALLLCLLPTAILAQTATPAGSQAGTAADPGIRTIAEVERGIASGAPASSVWSPDSKRLSYIASDADVTGKPGDIVQIDPETGKASVLATADQLSKLSAEAVDEKNQDHRARYAMSDYLWAPDSKHLLLDKGGKLWLYNISAGTGVLVADTHEGSGDDPKFSPDGTFVSYLHHHNLYVHRVGGGETAVTNTTEDTLLNGEVDWVYLEELDVRSNYFWSPDSKSIAYLQMDEARVPQYPITDWIPTHATVDYQRYPQPGDPNPNVRVGVVSAQGGKTRFIEVPLSANNDYIPRFGWVDSNTVFIEVLTRSHQHLSIYFADVHTGKTRRMTSDNDPKFLNFSTDLDILPHGRFLLQSWRDGHNHIYLYSFDEHSPLAADATLTRQLTQGDYEVEDVMVEPNAETIFYLATVEGDPLKLSFWSIQPDGSKRQRLTTDFGSLSALVAPDGSHFSLRASDSRIPPAISMCSTGQSCLPIWKAKPLAPATGVTRSIITLTAADGKTKLYGSLTLPASTVAASVPLILNPYNGPLASAAIMDVWDSPSFDEVLAQRGFAVLNVDGRGTGGRGREFVQASYHDFGPVQFSDQLAALDQVLGRYSQLDPKRLGWWGWSWGGSFTLYAMTHSDRFRAGVAVAPVTDYRNYDSIYTERFLGLPSENAQVYTDDAPVTNAAKLKGRLLIAQGTGDDNVHMANMIQFLQPLIDAGIPYDLQLFPRKTHSIAGPSARNELFSRILWQFETYLKPVQ